MSAAISELQRIRAAYVPKLPKALRSSHIKVEMGGFSEPSTDREEIKRLFPHTFGQPVIKLVEGKGTLKSAPMRVGVVLSGGQAPGGHNVVAGLFDALKASNSESTLYGFLKGPGGIIKGKYKALTSELIDEYRNTGGFDMIMSGRDKIEKPDDLAACKKNCEDLGLDGLVVVGGDDSNTNAAVLAEYLEAQGSKTAVIGVPKTIDGDMKNDQIEASFGFDTAAKTYSEQIGNICRDASSAVKYWHFIRLMGRAASHVTLECALQTRPNISLISEEIQARKITLEQIVDGIVTVIVERAKAGKNYGIAIVPEGLLEFISDIKVMIDELSNLLGKEEAKIRSLPAHSDRAQYVIKMLSAAGAAVYASLPADIQAVLLTRDSHGNVPLSQVETERLLIGLVSNKIRALKAKGLAAEVKFSPLAHFFGYEGRCAAPSNFDADYCYSLGYSAGTIIRAGVTGYTVNVQNINQPSDMWVAGAAPITMMLNMEIRKGKPTPVIKKALVDLNGKPFKFFAENRDRWAMTDCYLFPGPIQYFGPSEVCDLPTVTLRMEKSK
jgi:pyrophosphate--fructose-6-phosphate 1-phosphotransferase